MDRYPTLLAETDMGSVIVWSLVLIAAVVGLFFGVALLKKWMKRNDESNPVGFTLADLRELHKKGQMSDDEFEKAKAKIVDAAKAALARKASADQGARRAPTDKIV